MTGLPSVTDVLDSRPGCWRVRKRFLGVGDDVRPMCVNAVCTEQPAPTPRSGQIDGRSGWVELVGVPVSAIFVAFARPFEGLSGLR